MARNMEKHIRIVGGIFITFGIFYLLATLFIGVIGLLAWINEAQTTTVPFLPTSLTGIVILLPFTLLGILHLFTGRAFRAGRGWARFALWILAIINLGNIPLGTAIGAYAIWVLIRTNESVN